MVSETAPSPRPDPRRLTLRGGALCLDFLNTVDPRTGVNDVDYLPGYPELVAWGAHAGAIAEEEVAGLTQRGAAHPEQARALVAEARELREALFRVFAALAGDGEPAAGDLAVVNRWVARSLGHARLVRDEGPGATANGPYRLDFDAEPHALDRVLWPVVRSAAELLASSEVARVRVCAGEDCGWAFLDVSKNRSRRWCTMDVCGNRAKARRHYARHRRPGRTASA